MTKGIGTGKLIRETVIRLKLRVYGTEPKRRSKRVATTSRASMMNFAPKVREYGREVASQEALK